MDYKFDTFSANLIVIWLMTLILTVTLYFDVLRKILEIIAGIDVRVQLPKYNSETLTCLSLFALERI